MLQVSIFDPHGRIEYLKKGGHCKKEGHTDKKREHKKKTHGKFT